MNEMEIVAVVGNPNPGGRTTQTAEAVARQVAHLAPWASVDVIELASIAGELFVPDSSEVSATCNRVAAADVAVFASPTYKASFTGLLKAFLDRYDANGLVGVVAIPVMVGSRPEHALAPEVHLRPVLVELAASVPTKGFFIVDSDIDLLGEQIASWWELARAPMRRTLGL